MRASFCGPALELRTLTTMFTPERSIDSDETVRVSTPFGRSVGDVRLRTIIEENLERESGSLSAVTMCCPSLPVPPAMAIHGKDDILGLELRIWKSEKVLNKS